MPSGAVELTVSSGVVADCTLRPHAARLYRCCFAHAEANAPRGGFFLSYSKPAQVLPPEFPQAPTYFSRSRPHRASIIDNGKKIGFALSSPSRPMCRSAGGGVPATDLWFGTLDEIDLLESSMTKVRNTVAYADARSTCRVHEGCVA
jgi:hypothetical protein